MEQRVNVLNTIHKHELGGKGMGKHALTIPVPDKVWEALAVPPYNGNIRFFEDIAMQEGFRLLLRTPALQDLTEDQFFDLCQINRKLRIEQSKEGDILIMSPTGGATSWRNSRIVVALVNWAEMYSDGIVFDSNGGFILPNGAMRSPDASWVKRSRLTTLTPDQKQKFLPLCPEFVVELRSPSDSLKELQAKMEEYRENGALLGWLLDPAVRRGYVYRPEQAVDCLENPSSLSGDPVLPGFVLNLDSLWTPDF